MGITYTFLPDGRPIFPPVNPTWWNEGDHVTFDKLSYFMGQAGMFLAAKPLYVGLGTTSTSTPVGRTSVGFQTDVIDSSNGHNPGSNNTQFAIPETGNGQSPVDDYYLCIGYIPFKTDDASDLYSVQLVSRGSSYTYRTGMQITGGSGGYPITTLAVDLVNATGQSSGGPYLTLDAYIYATNSSSTSTSGKCPILMVQWVGGSWTWSPLQAPIAVPHTWIDADEATASATGASSQPGGQKVPLNTEVMQNVAFHTSPPAFRANSTTGTASTAVSGVWTSVPLPHMDIDNFGGWSSGTNTRYTAKQSGLYFISGTTSWTEGASPTGYRVCRLRVNGDNSQVYGGNSFQTAAGGANNECTTVVASLIQLNAGDYVELQFSHNQGSSLTLDNLGDSHMIATWQSL